MRRAAVDYTTSLLCSASNSSNGNWARLTRFMCDFGTEGPQLTCHYLNYLRSRARIRKIKVFREWLLQELETQQEQRSKFLRIYD